MFDWRQYLDLADDLHSQFPDNEAAQRAAISRAYYAVFGVAQDYLRATDVPIARTGRAHERVWAVFGQAPRGSRQRIYQDGRRLKRRREMADYDAVYEDLAFDARVWIGIARQLIDDIDRLD